jgi:hypothetical protein
VQYVSLTECKSGTIQKLSFGVNNTIELRNITAPSKNNGLYRVCCARSVPVSSGVAVIILSTILVLTPNGKF